MLKYKIGLDSPPVKTDILFLGDTTGAMINVLATSRDSAVDLTNVFGDRESVAFGVGSYKDEI